MEVLNDNSAMLSNYEVYSLLSDIQSGKGHKKPNKNQQNLATITYETMKHLENTSCNDKDPEKIKELMNDLEPYGLTKAEKLQILNQCPKTAVEIQLIVEESEERLTENQIYELLDCVLKFNPSSETNMEDEQDGEDNITEMDS